MDSCGAGVRSALSWMSSHQNLTSSVVASVPSDHLRPLRKWKVYSVASLDCSHLSMMLGITFNVFGSVASHAIMRASMSLPAARRSEEHTSELQSRPHLVCR